MPLWDVCQKLALNFQTTVEGLDKAKFLMAVAGVESSYGKNLGPRVEPGYSPGGMYFNNPGLQDAYKKYGSDASASWGPWQILYIAARELGYAGVPEALKDPEISGPFVVAKFNRISRNGANSVERLLTAWNTGSWKKGATPLEYIAQFWNYYNELSKGGIA